MTDDREQRNAGDRPAPGRRPPATSRARTGGSARPVSSGAPGGSSGVPGTGAGAGGPRRPPSFAPNRGSGTPPPSDRASQPDQRPDRTRVMPSATPAGRTPAAQRRPADAPPGQGRPAPKPAGGSAPRRRRRGRRLVAILVLLLVLVLAWPVGLLVWANGKIQHVDAGSPTLSTAGTTYLLAGSDSRDDGYFEHDPTEGQRADTIMILTVPPSGNASLISLPRDTYVDIPGHRPHKLNTAYAWGGPALLRETVESLTGIEVDHYVEIGMGGLAGLVDAVGGVELCLGYDVSDRESQLEWTAGCHLTDGATALAFARMRMSDPLGDIGRTQRQQQVIQAVTGKLADPSVVFRPGEQIRLADAGLAALYVSEGTNIVNLGRMALGFRSATGEDGVQGAPPIVSMDYRPGGGVGSTVLLADDYPAFFASVADGTVTNDDTGRLG